MKKSKLPKTDSIQQLAEFWDTHDLTDFEDELEEVAEPVFGRRAAIKVPLESREVEAVEQIARAKGLSREELIRAWVLQKSRPTEQRRPNQALKLTGAAVSLPRTINVFQAAPVDWKGILAGRHSGQAPLSGINRGPGNKMIRALMLPIFPSRECVAKISQAKTRVGRQIVGWWRRPQARKEHSSPTLPSPGGLTPNL